MPVGWLLVISACLGLSRALLLRSDPPPCHQFKCPEKFAPKVGHHTLVSDKLTECCDETCEHYALHTGCGDGYVENEDYYTNVGHNDQICCDKVCGHDYQCKPGYVSTDQDKAGVTHEECCIETCALWNCTGAWRPDASKTDLVAQSNEECCAPTCALFNCQGVLSMWFPDESKNGTVGSSVDVCCVPQCKFQDLIECSDGYGVPPWKENDTTTNGTDYCCDMTCRVYECGEGYVKNMSQVDEFGSDDAYCCVPTCQLFTCNLDDGWATDSSLDPILGSSSSVCCKPTCQLFTCNATLLWLAPTGNESRANMVANTSEACCEKSCLAHTCSVGRTLIPTASETIGHQDEVCCEDERCPNFRDNLTPLSDDEFCNQMSRDECETRFYNANGTLLQCQWDTTYRLCRYDSVLRIKGCRGF